MSIYALIFVEQPYFNEPCFEVEEGTERGRRASRDYNGAVRAKTVELAMLGQYRRATGRAGGMGAAGKSGTALDEAAAERAPGAMDEVVRRHFDLQVRPPPPARRLLLTRARAELLLLPCVALSDLTPPSCLAPSHALAPRRSWTASRRSSRSGSRNATAPAPSPARRWPQRHLLPRWPAPSLTSASRKRQRWCAISRNCASSSSWTAKSAAGEVSSALSLQSSKKTR